MSEIIFKEEVYIIVGCCLEVWKTLGYGFSEIVYKDSMEQEFIENQISFTREPELPVLYKGRKLRHKFQADFLMFENIIVEVKASDNGINENAISQTLNYLRASGSRLGLIINFGKTRMEYKRLIL